MLPVQKTIFATKKARNFVDGRWTSFEKFLSFSWNTWRPLLGFVSASVWGQGGGEGGGEKAWWILVWAWGWGLVCWKSSIDDFRKLSFGSLELELEVRLAVFVDFAIFFKGWNGCQEDKDFRISDLRGL